MIEKTVSEIFPFFDGVKFGGEKVNYYNHLAKGICPSWEAHWVALKDVAVRGVGDWWLSSPKSLAKPTIYFFPVWWFWKDSDRAWWLCYQKQLAIYFERGEKPRRLEMISPPDGVFMFQNRCKSGVYQTQVSTPSNFPTYDGGWGSFKVEGACKI